MIASTNSIGTRYDGCVILRPTRGEVAQLAHICHLRSRCSHEQNEQAHLRPVQAKASRSALASCSSAAISSSR